MDTKELYPGYGEDVRLTRVVPAPRQIAHQELEYFGFIHFTVNTFTGREWGNGGNPPLFSIRRSWMQGSGWKRRSGEE